MVLEIFPCVSDEPEATRNQFQQRKYEFPSFLREIEAKALRQRPSSPPSRGLHFRHDTTGPPPPTHFVSDTTVLTGARGKLASLV